ncbi:UBX domain-containing protein 11 isoform X3 [Rattus norvegicus]|uniref:UBX domain-containing protein 11 isoform X3 n=1 Tax=Rattus norvegicus TaxID=10116 RepID=UPI0003D10062
MRSARVLVAWETPRQQDGGAAGRLAGPVESLTVNPNTGAMSSPLASLSKTRKVPLESEPVNPGRRGIRIYGDEDEVDMVNDGQDSEEKISLPSCYGGIGRQGLMIHDSELLTSMARKLQELEQQLKARNEEMLSKEQKILALEDLVQTLQQHQSSTTREEELETQCIQLQRQVGEMERFLNDYGLQWVGEPMDQENSEGKIISESDERDWMKAKKFWKPGDSIVPPEVDFDRLLSSLQDLSELVVEGEAQVTPVPGGAQFRTLEPIPLKLYRNGIMMFDGPFRPFYDPYTQRCLRDILDGFFPSELQRLYPDGVPFKNCCPMPVRIQEIIVETPALASERQRTQESPNMPVPPLSMLRIKSENGEQAFLLMMRPEDTIGDVRNLLAQARDMDSAAFEILSTFPPTVYRDDTVTLQAAGLVPNATLLLRTRRVLPANPSFGTDSGPGSLP